jgi:hypothetical protein
LVAAGLVALCAFLAASSAVKADYVITPTAVYANSGTEGNPYDVDKMIDGIYGPGARNMTVLTDDTLPVSDPITAHVVFDLGAQYTLSGAMLWARSDSSGYTPKDVDYFYYTDDTPSNHAILDDLEGDSGIVALWTGSISPLGAGESETSAFNSPVTARYVGLRINSSYGFDSAQIGEMQFSAVPEPSACALLMAALIGLLCYAWKKRR